MASSISAVLLVFFSGVFPLMKDERFLMRFTLVIVVIMLAQDPWWLRLFDMVFIGLRLMQMLSILYASVTDARDLHVRLMSRLRNFR
jgi:hypothetical protein